MASPNTQQQAEHASGKSVLLSFALYSPWMDRYQQSFDRVLIDSGAFSEFSSGARVDLGAYREWSQEWLTTAEAVAGLDDISGDWRRSLRNYGEIPWGFPTIHDSDPVELLDDLIPMARERGNWIGVGLTPPRQGKESWVKRTTERIPDDLHVHGWACGNYTHIRRFDSVDSTNWWRDGMKYRQMLPWLHYGEALDIVIKRIERQQRLKEAVDESQMTLGEIA